LPGGIPEETIAELLRRADIVEVIGEHVALRKVGAGYQGLCPFHPDSKPSFHVNAARQFFHCFGCGAGGNVFHFLMQLHHMTFPEAVRHMAARYGLKIPEREPSPEEKRRREQRDVLLEANELAAAFFRRILLGPDGERARRYLQARGISEQTQEVFGLGLAPPGWKGLVDHLRRRGFSPSVAEHAGLIIQKEGGGHYDRFRGRLIFPIHDEGGRVIGFGGRTLSDETPKYINSPDSAIFSKGKNLYGLHLARGAVRELESVVVVEGYTDLLALYEAGVRNVVATLGTALTLDHLHKLKRYTNSVIHVFDSDEAGERATMRALDLCLELGIWGRVLRLPPSHDPDSYVRQVGGEVFRKELGSAIPLMDYWIQRVLPRGDLSNPEEKIRCLEQVVPRLRKLANPVALDHYVAIIAERLRVREGRVRELLKGGDLRVSRTALEEAPCEDPVRTERLLLKAVLSRPALSRLLPEDALEGISDPHLRALATLTIKWAEEGGGQDLRDLAARVHEPPLARTLTGLLAGLDEVGDDPQRLCEQCLKDFRRRRIEHQIQQLRTAIVRAEKENDAETSRVLAAKVQELILQRQRLRGSM